MDVKMIDVCGEEVRGRYILEVMKRSAKNGDAYVLATDVYAMSKKIHSHIIQTTGGIDGLRGRAGLQAAIAAPLQSFNGEDLYPGDIEKIARIGFGLR